MHELLRVREAAFGRWDVGVLVEGGTTAAQLEKVAREIAADFRKTHPYAALSVGFADYPHFLERRSYALGFWEDAPHGDWTRPEEAETDYSNFKEKNHLREKDWDKRPSAEQVDLWARAYDLGGDIDQVSEKLAQGTSRTPNEVRAAILSATFWTLK